MPVFLLLIYIYVQARVWRLLVHGLPWLLCVCAGSTHCKAAVRAAVPAAVAKPCGVTGRPAPSLPMGAGDAGCDTLLLKVYALGRQLLAEQRGFAADVYLRHRMQTRRKGQVVRYIPGMVRLEHGTNDYITEAHLYARYRKGGQVDCRMVAFTTTHPYLRPKRFLEESRFNYQPYGTRLFAGGALNPLHPRNRNYYRFAFLYHTQTGERRTVRLAFTPRWKTDMLVSGHADIDPTSGSVLACQFTLTYQMQHITVNLRQGTEGMAQHLPQSVRVVSSFSLLGNRVNEVAEMRMQYHFDVDSLQAHTNAPKHDLTAQCVVRIDTTQTLYGNMAYFDSVRPMPLRAEEQLLYAESSDRPPHAALTPADTVCGKADPASRQPSAGQPTPKADFYQLTKNDDWQESILASRTLQWGTHHRIRLKLPPLVSPSMVEWSGNKGLTVKTRLSLTLRSSNHPEPDFTFKPRIAYSFRQKQIYWELPFKLYCWHRKNGSFSLQSGGGSHIYNYRQAKRLTDLLQGVEKYDSLLNIIRRFGFHDYRDAYTKADFSMSPIPGLQLTVGARHHLRSLIRYTEQAAEAQMPRSLSTLSPSVQLTYTPALYYYRDQTGRQVPLYSHWPTLLFSYERGYAMGRGQTHYERIELDIRHRIDLYAMRTLYLRAGCGAFTQRGRDCFLDYDYFRFTYIPEGWTDELTGEFQLLSSRWYNESRQYLRFTGTYQSPLLLFGRLGLFSRQVQTERIYLNLLTVRQLPFYAELGYGVSTHLMNLGTFLSVAPDHSLGFGCRVVLRLFDD